MIRLILILHECAQVKVALGGVRFEGLTIRGEGEQKVVVEVTSAGSLEMVQCRVFGGKSEGLSGIGAVHVRGSIKAAHSTFSSNSNGLSVDEGGNAVLEYCTASACGESGIEVREGSALHARHCRMDDNGTMSDKIWGSNVYVDGGSSAVLHHCQCNGSKACGLYASGLGSSITATDTAACGNAIKGCVARMGARLTLVRSKCIGNGGATDNSGTGKGNVCACYAHVTRDFSDLEGQAVEVIW